MTSPGKGPNKVLKKGELLSSCDISADSQTAYCALGLQQSSGMTRYRIITVHLVTPHTPLVPLKQSYTCKHFGYNFSLLPSFFCRSTSRTEKMLSHQWVFFFTSTPNFVSFEILPANTNAALTSLIHHLLSLLTKLLTNGQKKFLLVSFLSSWMG